MTIDLNQSYMATVIAALAHTGSPACHGTLRELERQGVRLPVWVLRELKEAKA